MLINTKSTITDSLDLLQKADVIVVFAGAGMSVDSGIEQFRGNDGLWTKSILINGEKVDYTNLMTHNAFIKKPELAWGLIGNLIKKYTSTTPHKGYGKLLNPEVGSSNLPHATRYESSFLG